MNNLKNVICVLSLFLAVPAFAAVTTTYNLDPAHTNIGFGVRHGGISTVRGNFRTFTGTIQYDAKKPEATKVKVEVDTASIDTSNQKRDGHLKSPDFFDSAKFPKMTFVSTSAKMDGKDLIVVGDLTLHGQKKPLTLKVTDIAGPGKNPMDKKDHVGGSASGTLNRQDFGLTWNGGGMTGLAGEMAVGNDVKITIDIDAVADAK